MDLTNTRTLVDHLVDYLDSREHPGQQVVVYLDSLHPYRDDQTLEDLILSARSELREFYQLTEDPLIELEDTGKVKEVV